MKKILLVTIICILTFAQASMSKLYIGSEEGQFILGIEAIAADVDGGGGLEIRSYFKKPGIFINGQEYGSIPRKTSYRLLLAGCTPEGSLLKLRRNWTYEKDTSSYYADTILTKENTIEIGYGEGPYLPYH